MASQRGTSESEPRNVDVAASDSPPSPSSQSKSGSVDLPKVDLFVGNLSLYTVATTLKAYFERFGKVKDVRIMYHNDTGRSRRFGFVTFEEPETLEAVMNFPGGHDVDGKKIETNNAIRRGKDDVAVGCQWKPRRSSPSVPPIHKVFVGGIGQDTTENDLIAYFAAFGKITNATLLHDPLSGRHRGFAFVAFDDESSAEVVCAKRYHQIGGKTAEAKRAQQQAPSRNPAAANAAAQVSALSGRRSRMGHPFGQVHEPSASSPAPLIPPAAHNPLQVAFTNAALSIAFVLQQNMVRQQQQIALMNMNSFASQQFQPASVFPGHIQQQQYQQHQESLYPMQPVLPSSAVAALPPSSSGTLLGPVAQLPQQSPYFIPGHPLQGGDLYAAMTPQASPYIEAAPLLAPPPATVVLPKTDCNANNIQL